MAIFIAARTSAEVVTGSVRDIALTFVTTPRRAPASAAARAKPSCRSSSHALSMLRNSAHISAFPGTTLAAPGKTSSRPVVPTPPEARRSTASTASAAAHSASCLESIGVVPACAASPENMAWTRSMPAIPDTIASGMPESSSTGPCSICSSTNALMDPGVQAASLIRSGSPPADAIASASVRPEASREARCVGVSVPAIERLPTQLTPNSFGSSPRKSTTRSSCWSA